MKLFSLSLPLLLSLSVFLAVVVVLYFNFCSSWHWHNSPKFASVCVSVCRLIAQWAVKQASASSFNLTFYALSCAALWQQVATWQLRFRFVSCHFTECTTMGFSYWNPDQCERHFQFHFYCDFGHFAGCEGKRQQLEEFQLKKELLLKLINVITTY